MRAISARPKSEHLPRRSREVPRKRHGGGLPRRPGRPSRKSWAIRTEMHVPSTGKRPTARLERDHLERLAGLPVNNAVALAEADQLIRAWRDVNQDQLQTSTTKPDGKVPPRQTNRPLRSSRPGPIQEGAHHAYRSFPSGKEIPGRTGPEYASACTKSPC